MRVKSLREPQNPEKGLEWVSPDGYSPKFRRVWNGESWVDLAVEDFPLAKTGSQLPRTDEEDLETEIEEEIEEEIEIEDETEEEETEEESSESPTEETKDERSVSSTVQDGNGKGSGQSSSKGKKSGTGKRGKGK